MKTTFARRTAKPSMQRRKLALAIAVASLGTFPALADATLPTGGTVAAGSASIGTAGSAMTIHQSSQRAVLRWNSFSIGSDASVTFNQPNSSAIALNRVLGNDLSRIDGQLSANGQVFITNPNGILFGAGSQVNVGGLVASTLDMDETAFMQGGFALQGSSTASVTNEGSLTGQNIALVGARVINTGTINADSAVLAAGERVSLQFDGDGLVTASVDAKVLNAYIENGGVVSVGEGRLLMTAGTASELTSTVINNTGVLQANSLANQGGEIVLGSDYLVNTGAIEANGQTGGNITLNADRTLMAGQITAEGEQQGGTITTTTRQHRETQSSTQSVNGETAGSIQLTAQLDLFSSGAYTADGDTGGNIDITGQNIELRGATVSVTGSGDGGHIRIGGGYQGKDTDIQNATTNTIANTTLDASSTDNGDGGTVIVWSDQQTDFYGAAKATGGTNSGDGGFIEVSGKELLNFGGTGDASAANGEAGTLLLDPANLVIGGQAPVFPGLAAMDLEDPFPAGEDQHGGGGVLVLDNGSIAVASPLDDYAGIDAGAVYLYDQAGSLVSMLTGSRDNDKVGTQLAAVGMHHFIAISRDWQSSPDINVGAFTWVDGGAGLSGFVSLDNSMVGATDNDAYSSSVVSLNNGSFFVKMPYWDNGVVIDAGALIWGNGNQPLAGAVSPDTALVGTHQDDRYGAAGRELPNGNYVVLASRWNNGLGASTWIDTALGLVGEVSESNSLVGTVDIGTIGKEIIILENGNYVLRSVVDPNWGWEGESFFVLWPDGSLGVGFPPPPPQLGAVTWVNAGQGITGVVSEQNSLVGSVIGDNVGYSTVVPLPDGNYVVVSTSWGEGRGAVTWGDGYSGTVGQVTESNSLVGSQGSVDHRDHVGSGGVTILSNGNYVVGSPEWGYVPPVPPVCTLVCPPGGLPGFSVEGDKSFGAVTWMNSNSPVTGVISATNSLVGSAPGDEVGTSVIALANGNYVVGSSSWNNGSILDVGAVTWGSGASGVAGTVSSLNSLVGSNANDKVGQNIIGLTNGNYVVGSPYWDRGVTADAGAATWVDGNAGMVGGISSLNSLVGSNASDNVGAKVVALFNGNYVVVSNYKFQGFTAGAVTLGDGQAGIVGTLDAGNSILGKGVAWESIGVGSNAEVVPLQNGNFVVVIQDSSPVQGPWTNGFNYGRVTWVSGEDIQVHTDLWGANPSDRIGSGGIVELPNGNFLVLSPLFGMSNAFTPQPDQRGAVTLVNGETGLAGTVSVANSLVGNGSNDQIGTRIEILPNGNYLVISPKVDYEIYSPAPPGYIRWADAGAVTFGNAETGVTGYIHQGNSLLGMRTNDIGSVVVLSDGNYLVVSPRWDNGVLQDVGAITWGSAETGVSGYISAANSLIGTSAFDGLGDGGVRLYGDSGFTVNSPLYDHNALVDSGRVSLFFSGSMMSPGLVLPSLNEGANVVLQADNDIIVANPIMVNNPAGNGGSLTLQAGRNITFNANVFTDNGNLTAIAGDPSANPAYRDAGTPTITIGSGVNLDVGEGVLTLAAIGGNFVNNSGADAITTSGAGYWQIYSNSPDANDFGGLNSGNQALWNLIYGDAVSASGNRYIFEYQPTLDFTTIDGVKKGIRKKNINNLYAANGFVNASLYGNVFTQDTAANSLTGAPSLYSQGALAWQKAGNYPITFQGWGTLASTNGYALGSFTDGSKLAVQLSFMDKIRLTIHNILLKFRRG